MKYLASLVLVGLTSLVVAGGALAAPENSQSPNAFTVELNCGAAGTLEVVVVGRGAFAPGHVVDGDGVFHVLAVPTFTGTLFDPEGNIVDTFTDPPLVRGQGNVPASATEVVTCSFELEFVEDEFTFVGTGTVTGYTTGGP